MQRSNSPGIACRFHALREQYDQVTAVRSIASSGISSVLIPILLCLLQKHEDYRRELELANEKLRRIQAENE